MTNINAITAVDAISDPGVITTIRTATTTAPRRRISRLIATIRERRAARLQDLATRRHLASTQGFTPSNARVRAEWNGQFRAF